MTVTLDTCLENNKHILGSNYSELGKSVGSGLFGRHKILLSYNQTAGWNIVQLNCIQFFFRNVFGFYRETHFKTVSRAWCDEAEKREFVNDAFDKKMLSICKKHILTNVGTEDPAKKSLFLFAEKHTDKVFRRVIVDYINTYYQEGDIILVESTATGTVPTTGRMQDRIKPGCLIQGWEPENWKELSGKSFVKDHEMHEKLGELDSTMNRVIPSSDTLTEEEIARVTKEMDHFREQYKILALHFGLEEKSVTNNIGIIDQQFQKFKDAIITPQAFSYFINRALSRLEDRFLNYKRAEANATDEDNRQMLAGARIRNESLYQEIIKHRKQGKRVFVIAGLSHIFRLPSPYPDNNITEKLKGEQDFIVLTAKRRFEKHNLGRLNPGLRQG